MSGFLRGTIEGYVAGNHWVCAHTVFKTLFDALESHTNLTRIALSYGDGTGTDYSDGANPFGRGSFAVYRCEPTGIRTWPYYLVIDTTTNGVAGLTGGNFQSEGGTRVNGSAYVGFACAVGIGGDQNPWNGTTNNDGTDVVGTPRWAVPAGGTDVHIFPATNNAGNEDAATANNSMTLYFDNSAASVMYWFVMDDDTLIFMVDNESSGGGHRTTICGPYEPASFQTVATPMCAWRDTLSLATGVQSDESSGFVNFDDNVYALGIWWDGTWFTTSYQPDEAAGNLFIPQRVSVYVPSTEVGVRGYMGVLPRLIQLGYNIPGFNTDADLKRAVFPSGVANISLLLPWDRATTPMSGLGGAREGITFSGVTPP